MAEDYDVADTGAGNDDAIQGTAIRAMAGGPELIEWFGFVPWFGDDEIERLELSDKGPSQLVVQSKIYPDLATARTCRVTLAIDGIVELDLQHFYLQNVIGALHFRRAKKHEGPVYGRTPADGDIEIFIEPIVGLGGTIRCAAVAISIEPIAIIRPRPA